MQVKFVSEKLPCVSWVDCLLFAYFACQHFWRNFSWVALLGSEYYEAVVCEEFQLINCAWLFWPRALTGERNGLPTNHKIYFDRLRPDSGGSRVIYNLNFPLAGVQMKLSNKVTQIKLVRYSGRMETEPSCRDSSQNVSGLELSFVIFIQLNFVWKQCLFSLPYLTFLCRHSE